MKSNENIDMYNTCEGLGHQNSREFPFKNQQKTWLQSKCDFGLLKSEKIWKSDPEWSPMGDPKSIKNLYSMGTESAVCAMSRSKYGFINIPEYVWMVFNHHAYAFELICKYSKSFLTIRSSSAFLRTPEHVKLCQMIPNWFSLSLGWAHHFHQAPKTVTEYS